MGYALAIVAVVAVVQGLAWAGDRDASASRRWLGTALATLGVVTLALGLVQVLVPGFFSGV